MLRFVLGLTPFLLAMPLSGQTRVPAGSPACGAGSDRNEVHALHHDSLSSSFVICIPREVAPHYHRAHTEHVAVIDGAGEMMLGDSTFTIATGDVIVIPMGTPHGVRTTSSVPLRVLSVQSPRFDGSDRVPLER